MASKPNGDMKNLAIALLFSTVIMGLWQFYFDAPRKKAEAIAWKAKQQTELQLKKEEDSKNNLMPVLTHDEALKQSPRVTIKSDSLHGSISLTGLRFDDLTLAQYRETLAKDSPEVTLFIPATDEDTYFAQFGWTADDSSLVLPDDKTLWKADSNELTPEHPVTLTWKNPAGITFTAKLALDKEYMFTVTQSATDVSGKPLSLHSFGYINRAFEATDHVYRAPQRAGLSGKRGGIVHEGPIGVFDGILKEVPYKKLKDEAAKDTSKNEQYDAQAGWLGITDIYWISAIIPEKTAFSSHFSYYESKGRDHYQTDYLSAPATETTVHFFAGAKKLDLLDAYAEKYNIPLFDRAIDFGMFYFLTKPFFIILTYLHTLVGNFGIAIMLLTIGVKAILFPLANKSFKSMNQMKLLSPKMTELRERHKDDKMKMNQAIMELYKREKINPASGCLPMVIQIPVFIALYKVLYVTIEMRQAPFFGWIHDLSVSDPTNLFTLFGTIPWSPPTFMHLGIWPIVLGLTMFIQQRQSPPPPDPAQAQMMKMMPLIFLFVFAGLPAGLVIYYCWNNTLTILQQAFIAARHSGDKIKKA